MHSDWVSCPDGKRECRREIFWKSECEVTICSTPFELCKNKNKRISKIFSKKYDFCNLQVTVKISLQRGRRVLSALWSRVRKYQRTRLLQLLVLIRLHQDLGLPQLQPPPDNFKSNIITATIVIFSLILALFIMFIIYRKIVKILEQRFWLSVWECSKHSLGALEQRM